MRELLKHYKGDLGPECIRNNNQEMTLLMFAIVTACNFSVIREVIERMKELNIDINTKDTDQNTALVRLKKRFFFLSSYENTHSFTYIARRPRYTHRGTDLRREIRTEKRL